jgi:hypothetical protein
MVNKQADVTQKPTTHHFRGYNIPDGFYRKCFDRKWNVLNLISISIDLLPRSGSVQRILCGTSSDHTSRWRKNQNYQQVNGIILNIS